MSSAIPAWASSAHAAELYWDGFSTGVGANGGDGTWSTGPTTNWDKRPFGGSDTEWVDGSDAIFGGSKGSVTISGAVSSNSVLFEASGYHLTSGQLILTGSAAIDTGAHDIVISSVVAGSLPITKSGTGTLTLDGSNLFTGPFNISAGVVKVGNSAALGSTQGATVISPGATLEVNGQNLGAEAVTISGTGVGGAGAIINNGANALNALQNVTLAGPATVGGTTRWDIRSLGTSQLKMGGHTLTKTGPNDVHLVNTYVSNAGHIDVRQGSFWVELGALLNGSAANTLTIRTGAKLGQWNNDSPARDQLWTAVFETNTSWQAVTSSSRWDGPVTLAGATTFDAGSGASMSNLNILSGPGSLSKTGPGKWTLAAFNTYTGGTTVKDGSLVLNAVNSSNGTGTIRGPVTVEAGGILVLPIANALGTAPGNRVSALNLSGGVVDNTSNASNSAPVINFNTGTLRSNGGVNHPDATSHYTLADNAVIQSAASPQPSLISGRLHLGTGNTGDTTVFDIAAGTGSEDLRIDAAVTGAATTNGLTKRGTGQLVLNGPCLFTGDTIVEAGTLLLATRGSLTDSAVTVKAGGFFGANLAGKSVSSIATSPGGGLVLPALPGGTTTVTGTLELTGGSIGIRPLLGESTLAGAYDLLTAGDIAGSGTPVLDLSGTYGPTRAHGNLAVNGNKLQLTLTGTGAGLVWNNASGGGIAAGTWNTTSQNFLNGVANDTFMAFDSVTFDDSVAPGSAKTITLNGTLAPARLTVDNSNGDFTISTAMGGSLVGVGSLVKTGSGRLVVNGPYSYAMTGPVTAGGGVLDFAGQSIAGSALTLGSGGALDNATATFQSMDLQSGSANATLLGAGAWTKTTAGTVNLTATNTLTGPGTIAAGHLIVGNSTTPNTTGSIGTGPVAITGGASLTIARSDTSPTVKVPHALSGSGGLNLLGINNGSNSASTFELTGNNSSFSGPVSLSNSRLSITPGKNTGSGPLSLSGRSALHVEKTTLPNAISISASGEWGTSGSYGGNLLLASASLTGPVTLAGGTTTRIRIVSGTGNISGPMSEAGGPAGVQFSTTGYNTITLSGASTYTGSTSIGSSAVLNLDGSLGATAVTVQGLGYIGGTGSIGNGGSLAFSNRATLVANMSGEPLTVNGNVDLGPSTAVSVAVTPNPVMGGPIPVLQYTGTLTGGPAQLKIANPDFYRKAEFVFSSGLITLDIDTKALVWKGNSSNNWDVGDTMCWGTTDAGGATDYFFDGDSVVFNDSAQGRSIRSPGATMRPSAVLVENNTGNYFISSKIDGPCALTKKGSATLFVFAYNGYTGGTTVHAGRLETSLINPLGTGPVTVAAGGTLAGDATIEGTVTVAGVLDPGLSSQTWPSTLTTGTTTLSGNYLCQLDDERSDTLAVTGDLDLTGSILTLENTFNSTSPATFTIATYTGDLTGAFTSVSGMPPGYRLDYRAAQKQIVLTRMTYAEWAAGFPSVAITTPDGDLDGDGIPNLLECVLGGDPAAQDLPAILPTHTLEENSLVFHYKRTDASVYGTVQTVQWSPDLVTWIDIPIRGSSSGDAQIIQNGDAPDDISVRIPRFLDKMFIRLKVTLR